MELQRTDKDVLTSEDILQYIQDYEIREVPELNKLWDYYEGENQKILKRKTPDPNNPDNRIVVSYGRKIITTFTGYAYKPKFISYKANVEQDLIQAYEEQVAAVEEENADQLVRMPGQKKPPKPPKEATVEELFVKDLQQIFDLNNEHIKTSRAGRNTGIFGKAYEVLYVDNEVNPEPDAALPIKALPKFFTVDPREMICLYDYTPEPKIKIAIRFFKMDPKKYKVEVYYKDKVVEYFRIRSDVHYGKWTLQLVGESPNFYDGVPVVAYYMGDEMCSIMEPVLSLIDAYDVLFSDSMNEFDRFAFAYLVMKKFGLTDPTVKKEAGKFSSVLQLLKRRRVFENLPADADISFLTKDIPTGFIQFMATSIREQIHIQSHVPDFTSASMAAGVSGIAIQRLMFDFENLCSSAEADFDLGLLDRIRLISGLLKKLNRPYGTIDMVSITHKRNLPNNLSEYAATANTMKQAGFSSYLVADIMPDDVIPNVEEELERQKEEQQSAMLPSIESLYGGMNPGDEGKPDKNQPDNFGQNSEEPKPGEGA